MEVPSLCFLMAATLTVQPDRSQFFEYESFSLSCGAAGNLSSWSVKRNTSKDVSRTCELHWGRQRGSSCIVRPLYAEDSGMYWCESQQGECSNILNIIVSAGAVILEVPQRPVTEGEDLVLRCSYKEPNVKASTSDFKAAFYKDGVFIGTHPGKLTLSPVSKSDEGVYKCQHPTRGESPQSFLGVTARDQRAGTDAPTTTTTPPIMSLPKMLCTVLLFILYTVIMILCIHVYRRLARARADAKRKTSGHVTQD